MAKEDLIIRIGANSDKFEDELGKIKKTTKNLESQLATVAKVSGVAFAGLTTAAGLAVKEFASFDNEIRGVKTLLNESSFGAKGLEAGFADLEKSVLKLAKTSPVAIGSLNKALFDTISAGVDAGKSVKVLEQASKLATAGLTDLSVATDGITSALNAYGLEAERAEEVASKFFQAQVFGKTTIQELSSFFGQAGATASAFGVSLDELLSSVSAVTSGGVKTSAAFTGVNAVLANIAKPTKDATDEAKRLGIEFDSTALRAKGFERFLDDLTQAQGFNQQSVEKLFGSIEAQKFVFGITANEGKKFKEVLSALKDETQSAKTFQEAYNTQSKSLSNSLKVLNNSVKVLKIEIGKQLAPIVSDIAEAFKNFTTRVGNLTDEQKSNIASVIKWGIAITGGIASLAALGVAAIKASAIISALGAAFLPASAAASGFFVALASPIGVIVAGLAAVAAGLIALNNALNVTKDTTSIEGLNTELYRLKTRLKDIGSTDLSVRKQLEVDQIKKDIKALEELRQAKIRASEDFGTGELLKRPEQDQGFKVPVLFDEPKATPIPFRPEEEKEALNKSAQNFKDNEEKKTAILTDEEKIRLEQLKFNLQLQKAELDGASKEELLFIQRDNDLKIALSEARLIENEQIRNQEIALIKAQQQQLEVDRKEHEKKMLKIKAENTEKDRLLTEEYGVLTRDQIAELNEEEIEQYRSLVQTKQEIEEADRARRIEEQIKERQQFLKDEQQFGSAYAKLKRFFRSDELKGAQDASNQLVALQQSENATLRGIGKAAALTRIAINTPRGALDAYSALAGIPVVGPALGAAAATALTLFGAEQASRVLAANKGGMVPSNMGIPNVDSVPSLLTPNELVVPAQNFDEVVNAVASRRSNNNTGNDVTESSLNLTIELEPKGDFIDFIEQQIIERRVQGVGIL